MPVEKHFSAFITVLVHARRSLHTRMVSTRGSAERAFAAALRVSLAHDSKDSRHPAPAISDRTREPRTLVNKHITMSVAVRLNSIAVANSADVRSNCDAFVIAHRNALLGEQVRHTRAVSGRAHASQFRNPRTQLSSHCKIHRGSCRQCFSLLCSRKVVARVGAHLSAN